MSSDTNPNTNSQASSSTNSSANSNASGRLSNLTANSNATPRLRQESCSSVESVTAWRQSQGSQCENHQPPPPPPPLPQPVHWPAYPSTPFPITIQTNIYTNTTSTPSPMSEFSGLGSINYKYMFGTPSEEFDLESHAAASHRRANSKMSSFSSEDSRKVITPADAVKAAQKNPELYIPTNLCPKVTPDENDRKRRRTSEYSGPTETLFKLMYSMHNEILSMDKLRSPLPSIFHLTRGKPPLDIAAIHSELQRIGEWKIRKGMIWKKLPKHTEYIIEKVFRIGDADIGSDNSGLATYEFPWLDPGERRWEEHSLVGQVLSFLIDATKHLAKHQPQRYQRFEDAALEECARIIDTRNPVAARTLAFLVCLLLERNHDCEELYQKLERRGIVQATLLAPHWRTVAAMLEVRYIETNPRALKRIRAYLRKACKRSNAADFWPIIAHYLAGLGKCLQTYFPFVAIETLEFVKGMAKEHLDAIGQELRANYELLELDDPFLPELRRLEHPSAKPAIKRQDDDSVMSLDPRFFLRLTPEDDDCCDPFIIKDPLVVNVMALKEAYPSIREFDTMHYALDVSHCAVDRSDSASELISPNQWQAAAKQWPELGASEVADQGRDAILAKMKPKAICSNFDQHADLLYTIMLVNYGKEKIDPSFQQVMKGLFPNHYQPSKTKSIGRTFVKARDDYYAKEQPRAASVRDIVRCMLVFQDCRELIAAYETIAQTFEVTGVKNSFVGKEPDYGYRQVLVSVLHRAPEGNKMICEIQMHLESFARVREQLRVYYNMYRCSSWRAMQDFVGPESHTYRHLGEI